MTVTHVYGRDHLHVHPGRPMLDYRQTALHGRTDRQTDTRTGIRRAGLARVRMRSSDALNPPNSPTITSIVIGMRHET